MDAKQRLFRSLSLARAYILETTLAHRTRRARGAGEDEEELGGRA